MSLLTGPIELGGNWDAAAPNDVMAVINRMRTACLHDVTLASDRQPEKLRVDDHTSGPPYIWLHTDNPTTGWIIVDVRAQDWCNLAYQFGHELGHVFANSWQPDALPANPSLWIEESLVEAFSLRGLAQLAIGWEQAPPFPDNAAYAASIRSYRETILTRYQALAQQEGRANGFAAWFKAHAQFFTEHGDLTAARAAVPTMLSLLESDPKTLADLGALNRWPGRSGIPLPDYLAHWSASCAELGTPGTLPARINELLNS